MLGVSFLLCPDRSIITIRSITASHSNNHLTSLPHPSQTGHQGDDETPFCLLDNPTPMTTPLLFDRPRRAVLDTVDTLHNTTPYTRSIDRHGCTPFDVNDDGVPDIICGVGANKGTGQGFNEVYVTANQGGNITKVYDGAGLQKYTTVRYVNDRSSSSRL
jgi:hypothetical protein